MIPVYLEGGGQRTFASAIDWPGWSRAGRGEAEALDALVAYGPRYADVIRRTSLELTPPADASALEVVERLNGGSATDFGVPSLPCARDAEPMDHAERERQIVVLEASWAAFDDAGTAASSLVLRKGPRGGGRDLDKIRLHVLQAELSYLTKLGSQRPKAVMEDIATQMSQVRVAMLDVLRARARGEPVADPNRVATPWTPRYFVRRAAWHVLDHAWEIEDRAEPA